MSQNNVTNADHLTFESLKQVNEQGGEWWSARALGGTLPEDLPTPANSIQQLEKEKKKLAKQQQDGENNE